MADIHVNTNKSSTSITQSYNNASPISLPSLTDLTGGQIQSSVGNSGSNIGGFVGNNSNGIIQVLDGGAIAESFDFAENALVKVFELTSKTLEQTKVNTAEYMNQVQDTSAAALAYVDKVVDAAGANNGLLKAVLLGAAGLTALFVVLKFSKWGK
jgi:hypothetical protein